MPRGSLVSSNFTGGELSPAVALGRMDIAKYNNGARRIENGQITIQGGIKRRPGTRYIEDARFHDKKSRLIDFVYNRSQAYVVEMANLCMRFYSERALIQQTGVPVELETPFTEASLPSVNYVQKSDTAFFVHEAYLPQRLQRFSQVNWGIGSVPFIMPPVDEIGHFPATVATVGANTIGVTTITLDSGFFFPSDVGRSIAGHGGAARILAVTSLTVATIQITAVFNSAAIQPGLWRITGSPQDAIAPSSEGIAGGLVSLNANYTYTGSQITISAWVTGVGSAAVETGSAHGYDTGDSVTIVGTGSASGFTVDGTYVITKIDATHFSFAGNFFPGGFGTTGFVYDIQVSTDSVVWREEDVGKWVEINGGLVRIEAFVNWSTVNARVIRPFKSKLPAGVNEWRLLSEAWGQIGFGFPRAVTISKQRLWFAGSPQFPQHIWASEVAGYLNFEPGTDDDQGFTFELDGPRNSPIRHLAPTKALLVLTEADEMTLRGGQEKPITPTNIQKTDESTTGANGVRPVKVGNEILFVQAAGKKICGAAYRFDIDGVEAPDRTVFASHVTGPGIVQLAHQKEPHSTLFAVRTDGVLAVAAYDVAQEVVGWGRWTTKGDFESVASVPSIASGGEDTYVAVKRTIGGQVRRFIEVFDPDVLLDCAVVGHDDAGKTTWDGLDHLNNEEVHCIADGAYMGRFTVAGGSIILPRAVKDTQIGLYFTPLIELLQPGAAQGDPVHVNEVILRVLDTTAVTVNGNNIETRRFGPNVLDQAPPQFTGDIRAVTLQDEIYQARTVITQAVPLPFHLLDVIRRVTINSGSGN